MRQIQSAKALQPTKGKAEKEKEREREREREQERKEAALKMISHDFEHAMQEREKKEKKDAGNFKMKKINSKIIVKSGTSNSISADRKSTNGKKPHLNIDESKK